MGSVSRKIRGKRSGCRILHVSATLCNPIGAFFAALQALKRGSICTKPLAVSARLSAGLSIGRAMVGGQWRWMSRDQRPRREPDLAPGGRPGQSESQQQGLSSTSQSRVLLDVPLGLNIQPTAFFFQGPARQLFNLWGILSWRQVVQLLFSKSFGSITSQTQRHFGAFCLAVRTLTFCQLMGFPLNH